MLYLYLYLMGNVFLRFFTPLKNFIINYWRHILLFFNRPKGNKQNRPLPPEPEEAHLNGNGQAELAMSDDDRQLLEQHSQTVSDLAARQNIDLTSLEEMAYSYSHLAQLLSKSDNSDYNKCLRSAASIYDTAPEKYH